MKNLNPQAQKILDILQDRNWHCPQEWFYSDGHCKRITDINEYLKPQDLKVESKVCDCGRHTGKIFKRRLISENLAPRQEITPKPTQTLSKTLSPFVADFIAKYGQKPKEKELNTLF